MSLSPLRIAYLALAAWGLARPMAGYVEWARAEGFSPAGLWAAWQANPATGALAHEVLIAGTAFTLWVIAETRVRRNWAALWVLPGLVLGGLGFALPLYLFLRARPVR